MAWTVMVTPTRVRRELPAIFTANISDTKLTENIADAEEIITDDLSEVVFWDEIRKLDLLPRTIQRMARHQAAIITITRQWQDDVDVITNEPEPNSPILNWHQSRYDKLLSDVKLGRVRILDENDEELEEDQVRRLGVGLII